MLVLLSPLCSLCHPQILVVDLLENSLLSTSLLPRFRVASLVEVLLLILDLFTEKSHFGLLELLFTLHQPFEGANAFGQHSTLSCLTLSLVLALGSHVSHRVLATERPPAFGLLGEQHLCVFLLLLEVL